MIKLLVNGDTHKFKPFSDMTESEIMNFNKQLMNWHTTKIHPYCKCKNTMPYPKLFVRKKNNKFYLVNFRNQSQIHDYHCEFNKDSEGYKGELKGLGITINDDGLINAKINPPSSHKGNIDLTKLPAPLLADIPYNSQQATTIRYLVLSWLTDRKINEYVPNASRNVAGRLYHAAMRTRLNGTQLEKEHIYLSNAKSSFNFNTNILLIGWGKRSEGVKANVNNVKLVNIPFYSLKQQDKPTKPHRYVSVFKSVYEKANLTNLNVDEGYWVLYRTPNNNKKLADTQLIFIPACPVTLIPIHRADDLTLFSELVQHKLQFHSPLIHDKKQDTPDITIENTIPRSIVHVKRSGTNVGKLKEHYENQGYHFVLYDPQIGINLHDFPIIKDEKY